jgi:hypothetical protein
MSGAKHAAPQRHSRDPASRGPATNLRMYQGISLDRLAIVSWGRDRREDIHAGQRPTRRTLPRWSCLPDDEPTAD